MVTHIVGDATKPIPVGTSRTICHVCNNKGAWGAGFSGAITENVSHRPRGQYKRIMEKDVDAAANDLGSVQMVRILDVPDRVPGLVNRRDEMPFNERPRLYVANVIAQDGLPSKQNKRPFDIDALEEGLSKLSSLIYGRDHRLFENMTIHMPRVGAGLGGGNWEEIEPVIEEALSGLDVYVYTLEEEVSDFPSAHYADPSTITRA